MNLTKVSKFISLILRHKPEEIGIQMDKRGWVSVELLIEGVAKKYPGFNMDILEEIVHTDEKQRYSFNDDKSLIRANQGHSIDVDVGFDIVEPPNYLYHGTGTKYVKSIDEQGLIPKSRLFVHLSVDMDTAINVGKRHGSTVMVYVIAAGEMQKDGYYFYKSSNGVWMTREVPVKYLYTRIPINTNVIGLWEEFGDELQTTRKTTD